MNYLLTYFVPSLCPYQTDTLNRVEKVPELCVSSLGKQHAGLDPCEVLCPAIGLGRFLLT